MSNDPCAYAKDGLPEYAAGVLEAERVATIESHLEACADCRAELELIRALRITRPEPDAASLAGVQAAVRAAPRGASRRIWAWAAAASVVVALGTGVVWDRFRAEPELIATGVEEEGSFWPGDEVLIAGAPIFDELTDEQLAAFLEEWDDGAS